MVASEEAIDGFPRLKLRYIIDPQRHHRLAWIDKESFILRASVDQLRLGPRMTSRRYRELRESMPRVAFDLPEPTSNAEPSTIELTTRYTARLNEPVTDMFTVDQPW